MGAVPLSILGYQVTRPGKDGEPSSMTKWLTTFDAFNESERRNTIRTNIVEEAAHDKHLFYYGQRNTHVELKMPEYVLFSPVSRVVLSLELLVLGVFWIWNGGCQ